MILSGKEIQKQTKIGNIEIDPYDEKLINPNSYHLRHSKPADYHKRRAILTSIKTHL